MTERMFPIQSQRGYPRPFPTRIPWSVAEKAYGAYSSQYGRSQSLERLAERGGFGPGEMDIFHPDWLEEASEIAKLRQERDKLQAFKDWVHGYLDAHGVPHHPPGTHGAEGCRIGDRMDWLMERLRQAEPIIK